MAVTGSAVTSEHASSRPYLYEVDLIRAFTAFTVVAIHSIASMGFLVRGTDSSQFYNLISHALNYNREVFIFVTGLVLTYIYQARPHFELKKFYRGRFYVVFIPYVLWSIIYTLKNFPLTHSFSYAWLLIWNVITGNASPQLYYIILTLQIYLLFPLFLVFIRRLRQHPWELLLVSLGLQLILDFLDFHFIQTGPLRQYALTNHFLNYQDRIIPAYQFFLVLGGVAAFYMPQIRVFYARFGRYIPCLMLVSLILYGLYYYIELNQFHELSSHATTVIQPSVVLYSTAIIGFFGWAAFRWARQKAAYNLIKPISDMSFGIFFVHYLFLNLITQYLIPHVPAGLPVPIEIISVILLTFGLSVGTCYLLLRTAILSWTIGKVARTPKFEVART